MRIKIIAVNAIIVVLIGLLSFFLVRGATLAAAQNTPVLLAEAKHDVEGASARLQLDGLRVELWLDAKAQESETLDTTSTVLTQADQTQAGRSATAFCDKLLAGAKASPSFGNVTPSLIILVDAQGKIKGRSGSDQERGQDLGAIYPAFKAALAKGQSGSDVWTAKSRQDKYLTAYAPIHSGKDIIGAIVAGVAINDELSRVAEATTGRPLVLTAPDGTVLARSAAMTPELDEAINKDAKGMVASVAAAHQATSMAAGAITVGAAPLDLGDGKSAVLVASAPSALIEGAAAPSYMILGVMVIGLVLVAVGGWLLGGYITAPIQQLEEGLLAILNGQTDKRFELDHPDLGGLAFRIDQLLNQLMGIEEDTTDAEGRVSRAPTAASFASMEVAADGSGPDASVVAALAAEPPAQYYARIYQEYIAQKRALGEKVDHITAEAFNARVQGMEQEASQKQGRSVRFQITTRGSEVVFVPIAL